MKILIVPFIESPGCDSAWFLTSRLLGVCTDNGHEAAVCASSSTLLQDIHCYPSPVTRKPMFVSAGNTRSYEEYLYTKGALSKNFLLSDYNSIVEAIEAFSADLVISFDRIAAVAAAVNMKKRCWVIVHPDVYRNQKTSDKIMQELNETLSSLHMAQVYHLHELFALCERRIGFGPIEVSPFNEADAVTRIGISSLTPLPAGLTNRVCVYMPQLQMPAAKMRKLLIDTFQHAPYSLYIWYPGCRHEIISNLHFLSSVRMDVLDGAVACINDGSLFLFNQCMARGIPQLIISDHGIIRSTDALAGKRNRFALFLYEEELSVASFYESYRALAAGDKYYYYAKAMRDITAADGDLNLITQWL